MSVAYVLDEIFLDHRPPAAHPERPERLVAVRDALKKAKLEERGRALPVRAASLEEIGRVHSTNYIEELVRVVPGKTGWLDGDTYYSPGTWAAALAAVGAVVDLTKAVISGEFRCGMAFVRPPGHHAEAERAMGFCLLNNVAAGAAAARALGVGKVAIVDWDVHHGNGTQNIFYEDPTVLYLSCHQHPYYPGTGAPTEVGKGRGLGATVNVGLPAGCGDREYAMLFDRLFVPALHQFKPDLIMVSAGFDAHVDDKLAGMRLTQRAYAVMAQRIRKAADELCRGRVVIALEGGYHLKGMAKSVVAMFEEFVRPAEEASAAAISSDDIGPDEDMDAVSAARILAGALAAVKRTEEALTACRGTAA